MKPALLALLGTFAVAALLLVLSKGRLDAPRPSREGAAAPRPRQARPVEPARAPAPIAKPEPARREVPERIAEVVEVPARAGPVVAPHTAELDEFYVGSIMDEAAYLARADRRRPRVEGRLATTGPFEVQVFDLVNPTAPPTERILVATRTGAFTLWLAPGRYAIAARGRGGVATRSELVELEPGACRRLELSWLR